MTEHIFPLPTHCSRHNEVFLLHNYAGTAPISYCPVCRDNHMYEKLEVLGLSQKQRSSVMDLIVHNYDF